MNDMTPRPALLTPRLSAMMFLQFFIWGAWYVTGPNYLTTIGFTGTDFGWMYSVGPIAGMISPFFVGMIADRFFSTERVLGVMHLGAAAAMFGAIALMKGSDPNPNLINLMFFLHMLCYFPTLALVNTLAMRNMTDTQKQFPLIRVFGTIGWIIAGLAISQLVWDTKVEMFLLAAGAGVALGLCSFALPHTPPVKSETAPTIAQVLGLDALVMLKRPSFAIFMTASFLICIPLAFYYQMASRVVQQAELVPGQTMSFGQMSEIFFMLVMPLFFARLGVKWMLLVGMFAWVVRYALFAIGAPDQVVWMIILGVLLHGICYDFFFVTGQIYTDKAAPKNIRGQAQGMLVLFTLGLGMFIGAQVAGRTETAFTPARTVALQDEAGEIGTQIDAHTAAVKAITGVVPTDEASTDGDAALDDMLAELVASEDAIATKIAAVEAHASVVAASEGTTNEAGVLEERIAYLSAYKSATSLNALRLMDWKSIWMWPSIAAGVVMVLFFAFFRDRAGSTDESPTDLDV